MKPLVALAFLAACDAGAKPPPPEPKPPAPAPAPANPHALLLRLGRTVCYGTCPAYELEVFRDGRVAWRGEDYVKTKGPAQGHLEPAQLDALDALFAKTHFMDLENHYDHYDATDNPSALVLYAPKDGGAKLVTHYHGDMHAPEVLVTIENEIDRIVGSEKFIGTDKEREHLQ